MAEVASDLISNIEGYQQLLTTLSLGVCAGAFALITQVIFHNAGSQDKVKLNAVWLIGSAVLAHVISIFAGIATKSVLVSSVPALHSLKWGPDSATFYLAAAGLGNIMVFASAQIGLFALGILALFFALLCNLRLIK